MKKFFKALGLWDVFLTLMPIAIGLLAVRYGSTIVEDQGTRIMIGLLVGISLQYKGIDLGFAKLKRHVAEIKQEARQEISESLVLTKLILTSDGETGRKLHGIMDSFGKHDRNDQNLPTEIGNLTNFWIDDFLLKVELVMGRYSNKNVEFQSDAGMGADMRLVKSARTTILASTVVSEATMEFWRRNKKGESYRLACISEISKGALVLTQNPTTREYSGVARVFSFDEDLLFQYSEGAEVATQVVHNALEEARKQEEIGITVRLLPQSEMSREEIASLDILIVDNCISSRTRKYESTNGASRSVIISWREADVRNHILNWEVMWDNSYTIDDFCKSEGICLP